MPRALALALVLAVLLPAGLARPLTAQTADPLPVPAPGIEAEAEAEMTLERMAAILTLIDPQAVAEPRGITLSVDNVPVTVIVDERANRMRILVPVSSSEGLAAADLLRLLQANFDTALDARYAIANDRLWSTFIHPLAELDRDLLISGLAQTVTLAQTYGDTYTSGAIMFGGGDTRSLIQELLDLGEEL